MTSKPTAVVIGDMDLVRPLGLAGIPVVVAGHDPRAETRWSRYTKGSIELPDLWDDEDGVVDALNTFAEGLDERPVLFYQKDPALLAISRLRNELEPYYRFVVPDADLVEALVDKSQFDDLSEELDLPVPPTVITENGDWNPALDSITYPVVVKPAVRSHAEDRWAPIVGRSSKAFRANSREELAAFLDEPMLEGWAMVVQKLIEGSENRVWTYHAFIDPSGTTLGEFVGRKIRTWPDQYGQSTAVEIAEDEHVAETGRRVLSATEFTGIAKVDFKLDEDGSLYLLEVNPRFNLWHHPGAMAGVNLPVMVYDYLLGRPIAPATAKPGVRWCQVWGDLPAARGAGLGLAQWVRFALESESRRAAHLTDPGATLGALLRGWELRRDR